MTEFEKQVAEAMAAVAFDAEDLMWRSGGRRFRYGQGGPITPQIIARAFAPRVAAAIKEAAHATEDDIGLVATQDMADRIRAALAALRGEKR